MRAYLVLMSALKLGVYSEALLFDVMSCKEVHLCQLVSSVYIILNK